MCPPSPVPVHSSAVAPIRPSAAEPAVGYVDTHAHLDEGAFDGDRDAVVAAARHAGVRAIVNVGYRPARWATTIALAERHPTITAALGLHPQHADEFTADTGDHLAEAINRAGAVACGEIGLDYFRNGPDPTTQRRAFAAQIELARRLDRPIIVHQRAAEADLIDVLERFADLPPVVLHSFEGSHRLVRFATERRFLIGVGGLATRAGAAPLRDVLAAVPVDAVLLETDSPYLVPAGVKDRRNQPARVAVVAERLAPLWHLTAAELASVTTRTAARVFGLPLDPRGSTVEAAG